MNIEEVRTYALAMPGATEDLFVENWLTFRVGGKWFLLIQLDAPEPRVAVKLPPGEGLELREGHDGVRPAFHMNKRHWNDLYLNSLDDALVRRLILRSYSLVAGSLPKAVRQRLQLENAG